MSIKEIKTKIDRYCQLINVPGELIPQYSYDDSTDEGIFIEQEGEKFNMVVAEPFGQFVHYSSVSKNELLFEVFKFITFDMATKLSVPFLQPNTEARRFIWPKQLELIGTLSDDWRLLIKEEVRDKLVKSPVKDGLGEILLP